MLTDAQSLLELLQVLFFGVADLFAVLATAEVPWRHNAITEKDVRRDCHSLIDTLLNRLFLLALLRDCVEGRLLCLHLLFFRFCFLSSVNVEAWHREHLLVCLTFSVNLINSADSITSLLVARAQNSVEDCVSARLG